MIKYFKAKQYINYESTVVITPGDVFSVNFNNNRVINLSTKKIVITDSRYDLYKNIENIFKDGAMWEIIGGNKLITVLYG